MKLSKIIKIKLKKLSILEEIKYLQKYFKFFRSINKSYSIKKKKDRNGLSIIRAHYLQMSFLIHLGKMFNILAI